MVDSTIAHRPDFVNPAAPLFPDGWFRYASPADMPRETVDEFFECVIDVSASEEEAFLAVPFGTRPFPVRVSARGRQGLEVVLGGYG